MGKAKPDKPKKTVTLGVRVTEDVADTLAEIASRMDIRPTISQLIGRAIAEYIERTQAKKKGDR